MPDMSEYEQDQEDKHNYYFNCGYNDFLDSEKGTPVKKPEKYSESEWLSYQAGVQTAREDTNS